MRTTRIMLGALVIASLFFTGVALAQGHTSIDWWVTGSGGGSTTASGISLDATVGQWVVGTGSNGGLDLVSGFWDGVGEGHSVFMPLVLRQA